MAYGRSLSNGEFALPAATCPSAKLRVSENRRWKGNGLLINDRDRVQGVPETFQLASGTEGSAALSATFAPFISQIALFPLLA